jgi:hypothetical protein
MQNIAFRHEVLQHLTALRARWPNGGLYLLYVPGEADPLHLLAGHPRVQAIAGNKFGHEQDDAFLPHVIALDCRKVAAYLLETDPALDDPLLEASITLAAKTIEGSEQGYAVCGWIASQDGAATIARRLTQAAQQFDPEARQLVRLRWHDPRVVSHLWPQVPFDQRMALLGPQSAWVTVDAMERVTVFDSEAVETGVPPTAGAQTRSAQWERVRHVGMVNRLLDLWRDRSWISGQPLPEDAVDILHVHAAQASRYGLDGHDAQTYVLLAIGLRPGFENDADWRFAVQAACEAPGTFEDHVAAIPELFWQRYASSRI